MVSGANSGIDSVGDGAMTIIGRGSGAVGATNAVGVSIANSGNLLGKDGATSVVGVGGANSSGVQIDDGSAGAGGLGSFTVTAQGNGIDAGLTTSGLQPILLADQGGTLILEPSNGGAADALVLAATTKIQGNGNLIVHGANAAATMGIGGAASAAHSLQIDQTELVTIQPGLANITFGRGDGSGLTTLNLAGNTVATVAGNASRIAYTGRFPGDWNGDGRRRECHQWHFRRRSSHSSNHEPSRQSNIE